MKGVAIPPQEKVFSLFEPHTEWISKGKAGVPVELARGVVESRKGFILHHPVMENMTDDKIAVTIVKETQTQFSSRERLARERERLRQRLQKIAA